MPMSIRREGRYLVGATRRVHCLWRPRQEINHWYARARVELEEVWDEMFGCIWLPRNCLSRSLSGVYMREGGLDAGINPKLQFSPVLGVSEY